MAKSKTLGTATAYLFPGFWQYELPSLGAVDRPVVFTQGQNELMTFAVSSVGNRLQIGNGQAKLFLGTSGPEHPESRLAVSDYKEASLRPPRSTPGYGSDATNLKGLRSIHFCHACWRGGYNPRIGRDSADNQDENQR
jgi:hypothetical protein